MPMSLETESTPAAVLSPEPAVEPHPLAASLASWAEAPPSDFSGALAEAGSSIDELEAFARTGIGSGGVELLRRVLATASAAGDTGAASLLLKLTTVMDPRERAWERVHKAKADGDELTAIVTEAVKGGLLVDLGVRGFVPSSQIGLNVPRNLQQYVGQTLRLRVLEIDRRRGTVVLTNRQILEEDRAKKRSEALTRIQEGEERRGIVRRLTDIGAFVDVGGIDGLLHVSELAWKRVEHPSEVLKVGQKIQVKVLRVDSATGRVSLSMRQLFVDPWEGVRSKYEVGSVQKVKVIGIVPQGALVEMDEGVDGFIPVSEVSTRRVNTADEAVQVGQEFDAMVIDLRPRERRVVFSVRKLEQKKERQVVDTYQKKVEQTHSRSERTTLGDLFGHLFAELRRDFDSEAAAEVSAAASDPVEAEPSGNDSGADSSEPQGEMETGAIVSQDAESPTETGAEPEPELEVEATAESPAMEESAAGEPEQTPE